MTIELTREHLASAHRVKSLDGLRAIAIAVVFIHHAMPDLFPGGYYGVDIFFALSGYLITSRLLTEHSRSGQVWLGGFYARRFLRLTPALVLVVIACVVALKAIGYGATLVQGAASITYLMDFYMPLAESYGGALGHTWSLAVEEQFYLVWPALIILGIRFRWPLAYITAVAMVLAIIPTALFVHAVGYQFAYYTPFAHLGELGAGALLALVTRGRRWEIVRWAHSYAIPAAGAAALIVVLFLVDQTDSWQYYGGFTAAGLLSAAVIAHCIVRQNGAAARGLAARPMVWIGQRSYGIYLWHYPILFVVRRYLDDIPTFIVSAVLSLIIAELSWRFVETRFNRIKDTRFQPR